MNSQLQDRADSGEEEIEQTEASYLERYEECPSCALDDHRWVYECKECEYVGCYDEVYENGCYMGSPDERMCPECNSSKRKRIGKIGRGSVEEF